MMAKDVKAERAKENAKTLALIQKYGRDKDTRQKAGQARVIKGGKK